MATDEKIFEKEKGRWFYFFAKLAFFLIVFLAVLIAILSSLGGKSDVLKASVEEFLSARFGGIARVETLHQMTFYPYIGADFEGVTVSPRDNESQMLLNAGRVTVAMGFWDIALGNGKIKTFHIENLRAVPGVLMDKGVTIDRLAIIDEGDKAYTTGQGKIGSAPFTLKADMEKSGSGRGKKYKFGKVRPFIVTLDDINFIGQIENLKADQLTLANIIVERGGKSMLSGNLDLFYGGEYRLKAKGMLELPNGSKANPDILFELGGAEPKISGTLDFNPLTNADFSNYRNYMTLHDDVKEIVGRAETRNLTGSIVLVAAGGQYPRTDLAAELPSLAGAGDIALNCFMGEIAFDSGVAQITDFVIQTPQDKVIGTGQYVFKADELDLSEKPDQSLEAINISLTQLKRKTTLAAEHPCMAAQ